MAVLTPRPTTYDGIEMRSRLEATFAAFLDRVGWVWEYEPRAFANRSGQYLPDFSVTSGAVADNRPVFFEVKGARPPIEEEGRILLRMARIWDSAPDAILNVLIAEDFADGDYGFTTIWLEDGVFRNGVGGIAWCPVLSKASLGLRGPRPFVGCTHGSFVWLDPFSWRDR